MGMCMRVWDMGMKVNGAMQSNEQVWYTVRNIWVR